MLQQLIKQIFEHFFLIFLFLRHLYLEPSVDFHKKFQCGWYTKFMGNLFIRFTCMLSKLAFFILPDVQQMTIIETLDLRRSLILGGAGGRGPLSSRNDLGAAVYDPICFIYSSHIFQMPLAFSLRRKHNFIYFFHILVHCVNVQVGKCWP